MLAAPYLRRHWPALVFCLLLIAYAVLLAAFFAPAICEPDDNGYFAQGSLLVQTGRTTFTPQSDAQYIGMHWLMRPDDSYVSRYPPGFPLYIAALYATLGYQASVLANPILALSALLAFYLVARRMAPAPWALAGVAVLMLTPNFFQRALNCDSHMSVLAALIWGCYFLLRWAQEKSLWTIFVAGLILGTIPSLRYADSVLALGVAAFILLHARQVPHFTRHLLAAAVGVAIPLLPLLIYNHVVHGAFYKTGYSLTNEQTGFSLAYFQAHAIQYIRFLLGDGLGVVAALGVLGIAAMIALPAMRRWGIAMALWTVTMLLVYMAYYWAPQGNSQATMRFILPTFPIYVLAGVWFLATCTQAMPRSVRVTLPLTLIAVQALWGAGELLQTAHRLWYQRTVLAQVTTALDQLATANDVVVADNNLEQHLDFVRHWKLADQSIVRGGGPGMGRMGPARLGGAGMGPMGAGGPGGLPGMGNGPGGLGDPGGMGGGPGGMGGPMGPQGTDSANPSPMQMEKMSQRRELYPGDILQRQTKFLSDVEHWAGSGRILVVATPDALEPSLGMRQRGKFEILQRIELPPAPTPELANTPRGMRGRNRQTLAGGGLGGPGGMGGPGGVGGGPGGGPGGGGPGGPVNYGSELVIAQWSPQ